MTYFNLLSLIWFCLISKLIVTTVEANYGSGIACNFVRCFEPKAHYKDLNCDGIKIDTRDCCASYYDCEHLKIRSWRQKCFVNGHEYEIGEKLRKEDANRCEEDCICKIQTNGIPDFDCTASMNKTCPIYNPPRSFYCYTIDSLQDCCQSEAICSDNPNNKTTCLVDRKTYRSGEFFTPLDKPHLSCMCRPGFEGEFIEPFCIEQKRRLVSDLHAAYNYYSGCVPIYSSMYEERLIGHKERWACEFAAYRVLHYKHRHDDDYVKPDNKHTCEYASTRMEIGEGIHVMDYNDANCYECYCYIPPIPTCVNKPCFPGLSNSHLPSY